MASSIMLDQRLYCGLTLMEVLIAAGFATLLACLVVPSMQFHAAKAQAAKARRADAIAALARIELAQEDFRSRRGGYARSLSQLEGAPSVSGQGFYALELKDATASGYTAVARAVTGQAKDRDDRCGTLTLTIDGQGARRGPSPHCWSR